LKSDNEWLHNRTLVYNTVHPEARKFVVVMQFGTVWCIYKFYLIFIFTIM